MKGGPIPLSALLLLPSAALTPLAAVGAAEVLLALGTFGFSWAVVVYNVVQVSFRQRLCPPDLLGRTNASVRFLVFGTMPLGALLAGGFGTWLGVVPTLWVAVAGQALAAFWVVTSPLMRMDRLPHGEDGGQGPASPVAPNHPSGGAPPAGTPGAAG